MPHYMFQGRYSTDAIKAMVASPQDREAAGRAMIESLGGKLIAFYFCMGSEDVVAIVDAPDDETMAAGSLILGASGAMTGGATTKLLTSAEAQEAMARAGAAAGQYKPANA